MTRPLTSRRRFLSLGGRGAALAVAWPVLQRLSGCADAPEEKVARLQIPLAELPEGARQRYVLDGVPVEVRHADGEVVARSLLCTHQGCEVHWEAAQARYFCPCHEGTFDAEGRPTGGPPTRPLGRYTVTLSDDLAVVEP
jgi:Rieske Fe-S protein